MKIYILQKRICGPDVQNLEGFIDVGSEFIKTSIYPDGDYYLNGKYGGYKLEAGWVENQPDWFKIKELPIQDKKCEIEILKISDTDKKYEYLLKTNFKVTEEKLEIIEQQLFCSLNKWTDKDMADFIGWVSKENGDLFFDKKAGLFNSFVERVSNVRNNREPFTFLHFVKLWESEKDKK